MGIVNSNIIMCKGDSVSRPLAAGAPTCES